MEKKNCIEVGLEDIDKLASIVKKYKLDYLRVLDIEIKKSLHEQADVVAKPIPDEDLYWSAE